MTQLDQLRKHFKKNISITQLEATLLYCQTRISERIRELEWRGWLFDHRWVKENGKRFVRYYVLKKGA